MLRLFIPLFFFMLALPSSSLALSVQSDGTISCDKGKMVVFWEEDMGHPEDYRRVLIFKYEKLKPREYLLYSPFGKKSELLVDLTGGTNIPWRGLAKKHGDSLGPYLSSPFGLGHRFAFSLIRFRALAGAY